jgi:hypothetical protein
MPPSPNNTSSDLGAGIGCLAVLAIIGAGIWWILPDSWTDPIKYSLIYDKVDSSNVLYTEKPKDCDFMHAPLGDKGCHYKKAVNGFNAAGYRIVGEDTPRYSNDKHTDKAIVSYDDGKTWDFLPDGKKVDNVVVKVEVD